MSKFIARNTTDKVDLTKEIERLKKLFLGAEEYRKDELAELAHRLDMTSRTLTVDSSKLDNLKKLAEINQTEAKTLAEKAKADLMRSVVDSIDISKLPTVLQAYVIQSVFGVSKDLPDLELQEELKQFVKQEKEAEAARQAAEAREANAKAMVAEVTAQKTKKDFDNL